MTETKTKSVNTTWLHKPCLNADCTVVAEVAQAHDGSLGTAHAFIDAVADAGADAVKFQTHIAAAESTPREPWRKRFSSQDATRFDYWRRMEFSESQWHELKAHAVARELLFLSSPFSIEAVQLLERVGVSGWKVASGETSNVTMLDAMLETRRPIILSTGMSLLQEIDDAVARINHAGNEAAILQCTSAYPCPAELVGLNVIDVFRERYGWAVGLSDHSATIYPGLAAATLGINVLEVHITLSRNMFGPDVIASLTPSELRQLVEGIRFTETMRRNPIDKTVVSHEIENLRGIFTKSIVAATDLAADLILEEKHLAIKKPGGGLKPNEIPLLLGRRLRHALAQDDPILFSDLIQ